MNIVDLFSGAGGLTFGFYYKIVDGQFVKNNKWDIVFANEYDISSSGRLFNDNFPDIKMINKDNKKNNRR